MTSWMRCQRVRSGHHFLCARRSWENTSALRCPLSGPWCWISFFGSSREVARSLNCQVHRYGVNVCLAREQFFEILLSSVTCGGHTAIELCALELVPAGTQFSMLGGSPRDPQLEHRDRYHKPEKNDSLECHHSEQVLELPVVQTGTSPGSCWAPRSRGCGLCLRARRGRAGAAAAELPIHGRQKVF